MSVHVPVEGRGSHLVLFDGVCGLCDRLVQFLVRHDQRAIFSFASLQSQTGRELVSRAGGDPDALTSFYVIADFRTPEARVLRKSDAAAFVVSRLRWPWRTLALLRVVPRPLRDRLYDVVANTRYQVFGRYDQCAVPTGETRRRFIE